VFKVKLGNKGFSLVEIMIILVIVGLLAGIGVPYLLRVRVEANEGATKVALKTIRDAAETFRSSQTPPSYPPSLQALGNSNPPYIDSRLASGSMQGYNYSYSFDNAVQYNVTSAPSIPNVTGINIYYVDESGIIRRDGPSGPAI